MTTTTQTRTCWFCNQETPAHQTRYIARYDMDICNVCFLAWNG